MRFFRFLSFCLFLVLGVSASNFANAQFSVTQPITQSNQDKGEPSRTDPASWTSTLDAATAVLDDKNVSEKRLDEIIDSANSVSADADAYARSLQPRRDELEQQLSELGAAPGEGEPEESGEAKERRSLLNEQFAKIDAELKAARLAVVRSQQLQRSVIQTRQSKFLNSISVRSEGVFRVAFWKSVYASLPGYVRGLEILFSDGYVIALKELGRNPFKQFTVPFALLVITFGLLRGRRFLTSLVLRDARDNTPAVYKSRFIEFCRDGLLPAVFLFLVYQILWGAFLLTPRVGDFVASLCVIAGLYIMSVALLRIILMPREGRNRILLVNDRPALRIVNVLTVGLAVSALLALLNALAVIVFARVSISIMLSFFFAISVASSFLITMWIVYKDRNYTEALSSIVEYRGTWRFVKICVQTIAIVILVAALLGYIAFAEYLGQQLIFGLVVVCTVWLVLRFVHNMSAPANDGNPDAIVAASEPFDPNRQTSQLVILGTGIFTVVLYLAAAVLLLLPWGYRTSDFYQVFESVFFGFEIGGLRISMSTVFLVVGLFAIGYTVTVSLRNWLNTKLLPTTSLDVGVSNSISTVFGYIGFILAAIFAISVAGFDLSNLAIVAGALSVGVGFGLQSIVNNFVSGLILLAERPIKAGDWISTSGGEGTVTKISVRSTEIETFDRSTVIIPNSTLITDNVTNWTHNNKTGRLIISVGVGYGSDVEQVRDILLECARSHRLVLGRPEPHVIFTDFGASSLDFQVRCFLADVNYVVLVGSDLRFAILAALRKADIEIPFPQRDIHIRSNAAPDTPSDM